MSGDSSKDDAQMWRQRERGLLGGVVVWAIAVSTTVVLAPQAVADVILETQPLVLAGGILISIGLAGAFVHSVIVAGARWAEPDDPNGLTEVPWDE